MMKEAMAKKLLILLVACLTFPATAQAATTVTPWQSFAHDSWVGGYAHLGVMGPYQAEDLRAVVRTGVGPTRVYGQVSCYDEDPLFGPVLIGRQSFDFRYRVTRPGRLPHTLRLPVPNPGAPGCAVEVTGLGHGRTGITLQARFIVPE